MAFTSMIENTNMANKQIILEPQNLIPVFIGIWKAKYNIAKNPPTPRMRKIV
jgi:hypothetical protein